MDYIVCPKCGSNRVDRGQNYLVSLIGLALIVISLFLICREILADAAARWATAQPHDLQYPIEAIPLIIGFYLAFEGVRPLRRSRCRACGAIWQQSDTSDI